MNLSHLQGVGNTGLANASGSSPSRPTLPNGGSFENHDSIVSNDVSFPPGGFPSLRLPVVVALFFTHHFTVVQLSILYT